jgi:hypothetical protein
MNALQPPYRPEPPRRRTSRRMRRPVSAPAVPASAPHSTAPRPSISQPVAQPIQRPQRSRQAIAAESSTKLIVNLVLSVIALAALARLLPYNMAQQKSLEELQVKVAEVESRVDRLQADFNHNFDPKQARLVMQQESSRIEPGQRQIVWTKPERATAQQPQKTVPDAQVSYP